MGLTLNLHATTVAFGGRGLLILGPSGSGKSGLALQLMAIGGELVADDRTLVSRQGSELMAACPPTLSGLIEARGLGILQADPVDPVPLGLAVDLSQTETARLPIARVLTLLDVGLPLVHKVDTAYFPAALRQYILRGPHSP